VTKSAWPSKPKPGTIKLSREWQVTRRRLLRDAVACAVLPRGGYVHLFYTVTEVRRCAGVTELRERIVPGDFVWPYDVGSGPVELVRALHGLVQFYVARAPADGEFERVEIGAEAGRAARVSRWRDQAVDRGATRMTERRNA